jgi:phage shock protein E
MRQSLKVSLILLVAAASLAACSAGGETDASPSGQTLDVAAFGELVASPDVVVLDVRTPEEFAAGHLEDAVNLDVSAAGFAGRVVDLDPDLTYAVYCRTGSRSQVAMDAMLTAGIDSVAHLGGGIVAWTEAGGELVTGP